MTRTSRAGIVVFSLILLVDLLLLVLHLTGGWSVINLDEEGNLSAWYSSTKLLSLAVLCGIIWATERNQQAAQRRKLTFLWLVVALIFLGLSMDETASLHERLARTVMEESDVGLDIRETVLDGDATKDSFAWVLLLSPFIVATIIFFVSFFYTRLFRSGTGFVLAMCALALFTLAVALEATIYFLPSFSEWTAVELEKYKRFIGFEEAGELLGSTLFLLAFYRYKLFLDKQGSRSD
jgi:hypothetical protein